MCVCMCVFRYVYIYACTVINYSKDFIFLRTWLQTWRNEIEHLLVSFRLHEMCWILGHIIPNMEHYNLKLKELENWYVSAGLWDLPWKQVIRTSCKSFSRFLEAMNMLVPQEKWTKKGIWKNRSAKCPSAYYMLLILFLIPMIFFWHSVLCIKYTRKKKHLNRTVSLSLNFLMKAPCQLKLNNIFFLSPILANESEIGRRK